MSKTEDFLSKADEQEIVQAIIEAEKNTSGEIRVHLEEHTEKSPLDRAQEVFFELHMHETQDRNGVLFYVGVADKKFAIIGDEGIHEKVHQNFWDQMHDQITQEFSKKNYHNGLKNAVLETGKELKKYFPISGENPNELSNEITFS